MLLLLYAQSDNASASLEGTGDGSSNELQSKICEQEEKIKDLEQKVANLFMDNTALTTKLKAGREVETQQKEKIRTLEERLVQMLKREVSMHIWHTHRVQ